MHFGGKSRLRSKRCATLRPMNVETVERFETVESHVAHLERQVEQLNEVVVEQSRELERLKKFLNRISQTIETAELERIKSVDSKPPHYQ